MDNMMSLGRSDMVTTVIVLIFIQFLTLSSCGEYTIPTTLGQIKGLMLQKDNNTVFQFKGIPYAKPPIGNLRFEKPVPNGGWNGILDGTQFSPSCMQADYPNMTFDENCLYLNIYVPHNVSSANNKSVMVWIHGGGLTGGSASEYDGSYLALTGDVIVVTVNYRLNVFGFITSGDQHLPGNYGLWDQRLAIQWVNDNIRDFGGNPSSITIFGESAGGWSVSAQSLSPLNSGLFQRAIIQSGTVTSFLAFKKKGNVRSFAKQCDCLNDTVKSTDAIVTCLRQKPTDTLMKAYTNLETEIRGFGGVIGITVDGELIPEEPTQLLANKTSPSFKFFRSLDIIAGTVNAEGSLFTLYQYIMNFNASLGVSSDVLCGNIIPLLTKEFYYYLETLSEAICNKYKIPNGNDKTMMPEQGKNAADMYGDLFFYAPTIDILDLHSADNALTETFQYSFEHDKFRVFPVPDWLQGANHAAELVFLFGFLPGSPIFSFSTEDQTLMNTMLKYWTNFAKTGNPNVGANVPDWPSYNQTNGKYQQLDLNLQTKARLFNDRMDFWLRTVPEIIQPVVKTNSGRLRGISVQYPEGAVVHFRGVPFAQPPIAKLRFAKPQRVTAWNSTINAFHYPPSCIQDRPQGSFLDMLPNKEFSEDCLFLNLYIPGRISKSTKKSVMVWIHGGGYTTGQASLYDGSVLAAVGDVIIATVNYRLGVFGFISSNDSTLKGNYGLWDQKLAIEWVKDNIAFFGGDPESITIFGESAGGFSVSLQALSPLNKNLFKRVIAQSGTAFTHLAVHKSPPNLMLMYANALNCSNGSSTYIIDCLREKPAGDLQSLANYISGEYYKMNGFLPSYSDIVLKPRVDGELIPDEPLKLVKDKSSPSYEFFRSLDFMVGTTNGEGSLVMAIFDILKINVSSGISSNVLCDIIAPAHAQNAIIDHKEATGRICNKYKVTNGNTSNLDEQGKQTVSMYGDDLFVSSAIELLNFHATGNKKRRTYQYLFSRQLPPEMELVPLPQWFSMASHGSELSYMFGVYPYYASRFNVNVSSDELHLVQSMVKYWSNFAKYGDPNSKPLPKWPQFTNKEKSYIEFSSDTKIRVKNMLWSDRMKLWFEMRKMDYVIPEPVIGKSSTNKPVVYVMITGLILASLYRC